MILEVLPLELAVCRLDPKDAIPDWASHSKFFSITRTTDELSIVCESASVPKEIKAELGWGCLKVQGPMDFGLTGILASLVVPLAEARIPVFALSTFDTDYLLVKQDQMPRAREILSRAKHDVITS